MKESSKNTVPSSHKKPDEQSRDQLHKATEKKQIPNSIISFKKTAWKIFQSQQPGRYPEKTVELLNTLNRCNNINELRDCLDKGANLKEMKEIDTWSLRINDQYRIRFQEISRRGVCQC